MSSATTSSLTRYRPIILSVIGITICCSAYYAITYNQKPPPSLHRSNAVHRRRNRRRSTTPENASGQAPEQDATVTRPPNADGQGHSLHDPSNQDGAETVAESEIITARPPVLTNGGNLKELLYYIAEDQSRQNAYIHRGVMCNACYMKPIRGIRWRCATCADYDLCSECEASSAHPKTHIFYKVKIPAPFLGNPRHEAVIYPGMPDKMPASLPKITCKKFVEATRFEKEEIDALYDQFTCLANEEWTADPNDIGFGINRAAFDIAFIPLASINPPQPNLLYDRIFAFYDSNGDGIIGFEEFLRGLAYVQNKSRDDNSKRRLIFEGFDMDGDGYISRIDILRVFRAYYAIQKDITHDLLAVQEDEFELRHIAPSLYSSQPLSAIFTEPAPQHQPTFPVEQKESNEFGDRRGKDTLILDSGKDSTPREEIIANVTGGFARMNGRTLSSSTQDSGEANSEVGDSGVAADPTVRLKERYRRRQFYTDIEEGCEIPNPEQEQPSSSAINHTSTPLGLPRSAPVWNIGDGSDDEIEATSPPVPHNSFRPQVIHHDLYEVPIPCQEVGKEILYQVIQEGLNELLDPIFKKSENLDLEVAQTRTERAKWHEQVLEYKREKAQKHLVKSGEEGLNEDAIAADSGDKDASTSVTEPEDLDESPFSDGDTSNPISSADHSVKSCLEEFDLSTSNIDLTTIKSLDDSNKEQNVEQELIRDPTMPQFLPNSQADLDRLRGNINLASPISSSWCNTASEITGSPESDEHVRGISAKGTAPSLETLEKYVQLNDREEAIQRAGGAGRISFAQFEDLMNGEKGRRLAFVDSWFELGSF